LGDDRLRLAYCPMLQYLPVNSLTLLVRTEGAPATVIGEVKRRFQDIDRNLLLEVKTWSSFNDEMEFESIWLSRISNGLSLLASLLSCIGLYGVMAYSVARRTKEIGIRMALGAARPDVVWMILRETLRLVVFGIAVGLAASCGFNLFLASMLFGVKSLDVASFLLATGMFLVVALFAGYLPARRATKVDPMIALRNE
jgi:ABC-type antimicrobial peptide transport system permease subunit